MHYIDKEEVRNLLSNLVEISSPYFHEEDIMAFVKDWFEGNEIKADYHNYKEEKITKHKGRNVVVTLEGKKQGPVICLNGHLDSVMLCNGWTKNPKGEIEGDKLYGLGALDMKSGCAATMLALKAFHQNHKNFKGKIISTYVSAEEGPFGIGTNALIEDGYMEGVDFSIITEPSAGFTGKPFPDLCLGARGGYGLEIEFFGTSAHAATPEKGISAVDDAAKFICELQNIDYVEEAQMGKGSVCVVAMESEGGACSVPDYAKVKLFWHIVLGESPETIKKQLQNVIERAKIKSDCKINFREAPSEGSKGFMPFAIQKDEPNVSLFIETIKEVCGKEPSISYFQSIGDFNYLGSRIGAPAIIFGPDGENFHSKDEYANLESVVKTAQVVYEFLKKILRI